jgi:hypothetical protein
MEITLSNGSRNVIRAFGDTRVTHARAGILAEICRQEMTAITLPRRGVK